MQHDEASRHLSHANRTYYGEMGGHLATDMILGDGEHPAANGREVNFTAASYDLDGSDGTDPPSSGGSQSSGQLSTTSSLVPDTGR
jgi:hypothetical protein